MTPAEPTCPPDDPADSGKVHHVAVIVARPRGGARRSSATCSGCRSSSSSTIDTTGSGSRSCRSASRRSSCVQPTDDTTGVARFLASKGEGFHHVCFEVDDLAARADAARASTGSS